MQFADLNPAHRLPQPIVRRYCDAKFMLSRYHDPPQADVVYAGQDLAEVGPSVVTRNGVPLSPGQSQRVWNHSPDGFSWGYHGSGPAQLALALLLDRGVDEKWAARQHQDFKGAFVAGWGESWTLTGAEIDAWIAGYPDA